MGRTILAAVCCVGLSGAAVAQGIEPVQAVPQTDVTVGTIAPETSVFLVILGAAVVVAGVVAASDESGGS